MTAKHIEAAETFILQQLGEPLTFQQIVTRTGIPRESLRVRLRAMVKRNAIATGTQAGSLRYVDHGKVHLLNKKPLAKRTQRRKPPTPGGQPLGITDALRKLLAEAGRPLKYGEITQRLPHLSGNSISATLGHRVEAGEFVAIPATGRGRRYTLSSLADQVGVTDLDRDAAIAELRDHETYLREQAAGLLTAADRTARVIKALQA